MADLERPYELPYRGDDIVRSHAGRLVDKQQAARANA